MNATSRIEQATRDLERQFLVSGGFQRTNFRSDGGNYVTESRAAGPKAWTVSGSAYVNCTAYVNGIGVYSSGQTGNDETGLVWVSGNSIVIIFTGIGHRTAESFEGLPAAAPLLQVQFQ